MWPFPAKSQRAQVSKVLSPNGFGTLAKLILPSKCSTETCKVLVEQHQFRIEQPCFFGKVHPWQNDFMSDLREAPQSI